MDVLPPPPPPQQGGLGGGESGGGENAGYRTLLVGCSLAFFHFFSCRALFTYLFCSYTVLECLDLFLHLFKSSGWK